MTMQKSNATAGLLGIASAVVLLTSALGAQSQTPGTGGTTSLPLGRLGKRLSADAR